MRSANFMLLVHLFVLCFATSALADQTRIRNYKEAQRHFWKEVYKNSGDSLYCNKDIKGPGSFNIEHVFAAAWMKDAAACSTMARKKCRRNSPRFNHMEGDLHNLFPSLTKYNSRRGSYSFDIVTNKRNSGCDFEVQDEKVEPAPYARGEIARAILYMSREYGADIQRSSKDGKLKSLLLSWHCQHPPSLDEIERNELIDSIQQTRNPFIDNPELVDCNLPRRNFNL